MKLKRNEFWTGFDQNDQIFIWGTGPDLYKTKGGAKALYTDVRLVEIVEVKQPGDQ